MAGMSDKKHDASLVVGEPHYRFCRHFQRDRVDEHPFRNQCRIPASTALTSSKLPRILFIKRADKFDQRFERRFDCHPVLFSVISGHNLFEMLLVVGTQRVLRKHPSEPLSPLRDLCSSRAAFEEAVKQWPDQKLTLRQGIMLISEHPSPLGNPR